MKFFATAIAAAAAVSASAIFDVTNFAAGCAPHSVMCSYSFSVAQVGAGETIPVNCTASAVSDNTLPPVVGTCAQSSRTFTVTRDDSGLTLTVQQPVTPASNTSGSHLIHNYELSVVSDQVARYETYTGVSSFTLDS